MLDSVLYPSFKQYKTEIALKKRDMVARENFETEDSE